MGRLELSKITAYASSVTFLGPVIRVLVFEPMLIRLHFCKLPQKPLPGLFGPLGGTMYSWQSLQHDLTWLDE